MTPRRALLATLITATAGLSTLAAAQPAAADPTDTSTTTVTVTGGTLEISVTAVPSSLGSRPNSRNGTTISGGVGRVTVTDDRNAPAGSGWVASVVSTRFTPVSGPAIPASRVAYKAGSITKDGTATYTANNPRNLTHATAAVTASKITGNNTATWDPTIKVSIPAGLAAGVYTATITHSVV
jgi:hypothetical protein